MIWQTQSGKVRNLQVFQFPNFVGLRCVKRRGDSLGNSTCSLADECLLFQGYLMSDKTEEKSGEADHKSVAIRRQKGVRKLVGDYVSGTLPPPVSPRFLLGGLFGAFAVVAGLLLLANAIPSAAGFIDAAFFQLILTLLICFVIGVFIFGFTAGATARARIKPGFKVAIDFGGPPAAVAGLFAIILPNLSPTTTLTVYLRDAQSAQARGQSEFSVPEGLEVVLQLDQGRTAKMITAETQFGFLPKGADLPLTVRSERWGVAGIEPGTCAVKTGASHVVKAGCRTVWISLVLKPQATFTSLADLPPIDLGFASREVTLRQAISALADELQKSATARDPNVVVRPPDWHRLGGGIADSSFVWKPLPVGAKACAVVRLIEQAF